jgi:hypothetical protein
MRRLLLVPVTVLAMLAMGGQAVAGPEWCDDGSPPANDWRLRPTGGNSLTAPTSWLASTTSGRISLALGINTLTGGVAHGMASALEHARPYDSLPPVRGD